MYKHSRCVGCSACMNICPQKCISMVEDGCGFLYPRVDKTKCVECNLCKMVCQIGDENKTDNCFDSNSKFYIGFDKNRTNRECSSSGGIASVAAKKVLSSHGFVAAACFDNKFRVEHLLSDKMEDLTRFRGTKYVQSNLKTVYQKIFDLLDANIVLFIGTPCQVYALKKYFLVRRKDTSNLFTIEIVCHGVPSPSVWYKYLSWVNEFQLNGG